MKAFRACAAAAGLLALTVARARAEEPQAATLPSTCDALFHAPGIIWRGTSNSMTLQDLAAYAAPVFWLSPDEPTLNRQRGRDMRVPAAFPFETQPDSPVVYYEVTMIAQAPNASSTGVQIRTADPARSTFDLASVSAVRIKYITYFPEEAGVGQHRHDVEPTEVRLAIGRANGEIARRAGYRCDAPDFLIAIARVIGEAHGNPWYYNVLDVGPGTELPIHLLVEEGKHASATDKNADGYYTPGYDVTARTNDAWGVRDTIRGGTLFSGKFEAWMAKVRRSEHRVLPPLPLDSPLRPRLLALVPNAADNAVYELRPLPTATRAAGDALLEHKIKEKEVLNWPVVEPSTTLNPIIQTIAEGRELKPFSVALRGDGQLGLAVAFPLLVVKNVREPLAGGYIVNRMYFKDDNLRDWAWMAMYTPSASRWFDQYLAGGVEVDRFDREDGTVGKTRDFVLETGVKFRFRAPTRAFAAITQFWGVRVGVKSLGAIDIEQLSYVFEVGAGVW